MSETINKKESNAEFQCKYDKNWLWKPYSIARHGGLVKKILKMAKIAFTVFIYGSLITLNYFSILFRVLQKMRLGCLWWIERMITYSATRPTVATQTKFYIVYTSSIYRPGSRKSKTQNCF